MTWQTVSGGNVAPTTERHVASSNTRKLSSDDGPPWTGIRQQETADYPHFMPFSFDFELVDEATAQDPAVLAAKNDGNPNTYTRLLNTPWGYYHMQYTRTGDAALAVEPETAVEPAVPAIMASSSDRGQVSVVDQEHISMLQRTEKEMQDMIAEQQKVLCESQAMLAQIQKELQTLSIAPRSTQLAPARPALFPARSGAHERHRRLPKGSITLFGGYRKWSTPAPPLYTDGKGTMVEIEHAAKAAIAQFESYLCGAETQPPQTLESQSPPSSLSPPSSGLVLHGRDH
ncbi:hypothetical protein BC831DRAFT_112577 [Entophlyctis helioformis]|nr:hypothetical protein BC831DRAFT_112577 [Entophlyctis helioformis]